MKPVSVTYNPGNLPRDRVCHKTDSIQGAEDWIADREKSDPEGVHAGLYTINAPEEMMNP